MASEAAVSRLGRIVLVVVLIQLYFVTYLDVTFFWRPLLLGAATTTTTTQEVGSGGNYKPAHFYCLCPTRGQQDCNHALCDTILTYKDPNNTVLDLPGSTWTTARNAMFYLATRRQRSARLLSWKNESAPTAVESHFCFMDGDAKISHDKQALIERLSNETERNKIIVLNYRNVYSKMATYMKSADALLNCFSSDSMDQYLPYSTMKDHQAWYLSQSDLIMRANTQDPFPFKMYSDMIVRNPAHNNEYPHDGLKGYDELLEQQLSEGFSPGCMPRRDQQQQHQNHTCAFRGKTLFTLTFNQTHIYGH